MKSFVGVTDNGWFAFLSQQAGIDEGNFSLKHLCAKIGRTNGKRRFDTFIDYLKSASKENIRQRFDPFIKTTTPGGK